MDIFKKALELETALKLERSKIARIRELAAGANINGDYWEERCAEIFKLAGGPAPQERSK